MHQTEPGLQTGCLILFTALYGIFVKGCKILKPPQRKISKSTGHYSPAFDGNHTLRTIRKVPFSILLATACSRAPVTVSVTPETSDQAITSPSTPLLWNLIRTNRSSSYLSTNTVILKSSSDPVQIQETLSAITRFTLALDTLSREASISGKIESFSITAGLRIGTPDSLHAAAAFNGTASGGQLKLQLTDPFQREITPACTNPAYSALSTIRRNLVILPLQIYAGMT